jgi:hypothetical protein
MAKQVVVDNQDDIIRNICTFDGYKRQVGSESKFYKRGLRNYEYFIVSRIGDRYVFAPSRFAAYKNNNMFDYNANAPSEKNTVVELVKTPVCKNGDKRYEEVNAAFAQCLVQSNVSRNKKDLRYYYIIDQPNKNELAEEGERDGKLARNGYGGPPESEEHLRLKLHVKANPHMFGFDASGDCVVIKEEKLLKSRDEIDVWCMAPGEQLAIEVKSVRSNDADIERGIFQCVKYKAVLEAEAKCDGAAPKIRTRLVSERQLSPECCRQAKHLEIEVQVIKPLSRGDP